MTSTQNFARFRVLRQCARGVGFVALVFSLTVAALLATDWMRSGAAETVRSEVLSLELAKGRAQDAQAVEFARQLDQLARRAYFSSLTFRQGGMMLLVIGLLVTAGCFGLAWRMSLHIPDPRGLAEGDPARTDRLAVTAVLVTGVALLAAAAGLEWRRGAIAGGDRALRQRLTNTERAPEEGCACRRGASQEALDAQWPFLRGPLGAGRAAPSADPPVAWNGEAGQGVKWSVDIDYPGAASPVVWGQRLFVTTGDAAARRVLAYSTETGDLLWDTPVPDGEKGGGKLPEVAEDTGFAASSPACDGKHVYAVFGTGDLAALTHEGKLAWQVYLGRPQNPYGHASSLVYCGEMLLVQWDQEEHARVLAIDTNTGNTIWETPRNAGLSWATPLVMPVCDTPVLLIHASDQTWGLEMATGKKLWEVKAVGGEVAPSLSWEGDVWVAANMHMRLVGFKMPPEGEPQKAWEWNDGYLPDVSSPLIHNGLVFFATDAGDIGCHDLADGKQVWCKEMDDGFYASPIVAGGRLYVADREKGEFRVFSADREGKELAANPMGDPVSATPAFVGKRIYVRSHHKLWCVE
ncbi:MAG: PQQ-binding-like beta-propeller repeat protein [Kiritimatiellaeota bacterium]|nr:PQQ-binding-like beta-propeller repeat protein [Kiritimatiellota bacterium]